MPRNDIAQFRLLLQTKSTRYRCFGKRSYGRHRFKPQRHHAVLPVQAAAAKHTTSCHRLRFAWNARCPRPHAVTTPKLSLGCKGCYGSFPWCHFLNPRPKRPGRNSASWLPGLPLDLGLTRGRETSYCPFRRVRQLQTPNPFLHGSRCAALAKERLQRVKRSFLNWALK